LRKLAYSYLDEIHPERNRPRKGRDNEGSEQRPHIRRQYDECSPDIDLAGALVEEEHIKDEHQASALRDSAEEAIQDAGSHEGFEGRGSCTPRGCGCSEDEEIE
jgi:hypothetical protein